MAMIEAANGAAQASNFQASVEQAAAHGLQRWTQHLRAGAEIVRALQEKTASFSQEAFDLNIEAARAVGGAAPLSERLSKQMRLGASAAELYVRYLGETAELFRRSFAPPPTAADA